MRRHILLSAAALALAATAATPAAAQQATAAPPTAGPVVQQGVVSSELLAKARLDGEMAAMNVGTGGWFGGGLASGVLLGLIGTGVTWAAAGSSNAALPADRQLLLASQPVEYRQLYEKAYADKVKSKRKSSALKGGLVGTAAFVLLVASASGGQ